MAIFFAIYLNNKALSNSIDAKLTELSQVNIALNIQSNLHPKFGIAANQTDSKQLELINTELAELVSNVKQEYAEAHKSLQEINEILIDNASLLELELQKISQIEIENTSLPEAYDTMIKAKQSLVINRQTILEKISLLRTEGIFANPLLSIAPQEIDDFIARMSPAQKAGQLLMFSIGGNYLGNNEAKSLTDKNIGGIIYMGYNIANPEQIKAYSTQLQLNNRILPLLIATDQEGGVVKRVGWDNTAGAKYWANLSNQEICELATTRSKLLYQAGININFAPVVDLTYNGVGFINNRTIDNNPDKVISIAQEYVNCSQAAKVAATLKHFPGHGATAVDSHFHIPVIDKSKADWLSSDALPFKEITNAELIMVGHLLLKQIDSENPATLSKTLLTDILRNEFNYQGLIITDDMQQLQVATGMNYKAAIKKALEAGVDILLYVGYPSSQENIHNEITRLIETEEIPKEIIDAKLKRIISFKYKL